MVNRASGWCTLGPVVKPQAAHLRQWTVLGGLLAACAAVVVVRLMLGPAGTGLQWPTAPEILEIRLQRVAAGLTVGAALGLGGVLLQCLLRNPLASPDVIGLASGSGLGVMVAAYATYLVSQQIAPAGVNAGAALVGSLATLALVYSLAQRRGRVDPVGLVLIGVIVSILCGSATLLVQSLLPDRGVAASRWLLGAINDDVRFGTIASIGAITLVVLVWTILSGPRMDAASLGDDEARSVGVGLGRLRVQLFVASGVLAAGSVVLAGPVGFVGLVCPHLVRLLAGARHRVLAPGAALAGATLVVAADALVKVTDLGSGRLPITVLTSLIGGPLLIWLLRKEAVGERQ